MKVTSLAFPANVILFNSPIKDLNGKLTPTFAFANPSPVPTFEDVFDSPPPPPSGSDCHSPLAASNFITSLSTGVSELSKFLPNNFIMACKPLIAPTKAIHL